MEEIYGWMKTVLRRTRYRGIDRTQAWAYIVAGMYNLLRVATELTDWIRGELNEGPRVHSSKQRKRNCALVPSNPQKDINTASLTKGKLCGF